jgi:hypothetical protein
VKKSDMAPNKGNWNHLKSFRKHHSNVSGKHEIEELQKRTIMGTAHILRKMLMK